MTSSAPPSPGSSPRVWGEELGSLSRTLRRRLIPTRVGRGMPAWGCTGSPAAHPHACGERREDRRRRGVSDGSSPRVWGEVVRLVRLSAFQRLIPTRVGRGSPVSTQGVCIPAHPHACGERTSSYLINGKHLAEFRFFHRLLYYSPSLEFSMTLAWFEVLQFSCSIGRKETNLKPS